jgi:hypothetical protein
MTMFELWLLTAFLPSINAWANTVFLLTSVAFSVYTAWFFGTERYDDEDKDGNPHKFKIKKWLYVWVISGVICSVIPSKQDMLLIVGGYAATNNAEIVKLPENVLKAANIWFEQTISETITKK